MAQLRPSVLYTLLVIGAVLAGVGLIYGLFHDSEKFAGNRYENSYAVFDGATLSEKQQQSILLLKNKGIEWAHFRFIEAIKNDDREIVEAFINAGMPLNSNSILLEIALGSSANRKKMLVLLHKHFKLDLNALYKLPNYVNRFDQQLAAISAPYIKDKKEQYRVSMSSYKKSFVEWEKNLEKKKAEMLSVCTNDACRSGRINDVRRLFSDSKPIEPTLDYISRERAYLSLLTIFAWQKDQSLINFIHQEATELIANKLFLTDGKLIYFTVDAQGHALTMKNASQ